jgi:hypothetical protein
VVCALQTVSAFGVKGIMTQALPSHHKQHLTIPIALMGIVKSLKLRAYQEPAQLTTGACSSS